jgi:hypothetical protein
MIARQTPRARRRHTVAAIDDGSASGEYAVLLANRLAAVLKASVHITRLKSQAADGARIASESERADLLVVPRNLLDAAALQRIACPTLLVGVQEEIPEAGAPAGG